MTKVTYTLTDGTVVNTLREALASGQGYRATYSAVKQSRAKLTPKREEMLATQGFVR